MKNVKTEGIITKAVGGSYYVAVADGVLCCNARGVFRKEKIFKIITKAHKDIMCFFYKKLILYKH